MTVEQGRCAMFRDAAGDRQPRDRDQQRMFGPQHPRGQSFRRVVGTHRDACLRDHRAGIELGHHEMHAGPVLALAGLQGACVRAQAAIGRQQRGVDVEQAATEAAHEILAEDAQVAGAHDPVRPHGSNGFGKLGVETGAFPVRPGIAAPAQRLGHALQRLGIRAVGEHADDLRIEVAGREVVSIVPAAEAKLVQKDTPPPSGGSKVETLKGGDYVRVWINKAGNYYLVHLPNS